MSHDLLERLFVARDRVLDEVMRRIEVASSSVERNHTLLVGPRGAGKTHLVSLVYHRVKGAIEAGRPLQVAWLPEDPWTIVSYRHLLSEIVSRLEPRLDGQTPRTVEELEGVLQARAAERGPVVVIVENLDQILRSIEDDGQQRLRHLLQADRSLLLVATTTVLDRSLSDQAKPFYSFFTTSRLEPFDVDEAADMLTAIAVEREDDALVDYLASDEGRARLRTIEHLAGGQPRMWAALASALTVEGLDELVDLLLTRFDDLTPYYQEQLGRLSSQQRLVVAELAEVDRPITVKELAERLEIDQRSLGKTVSDLVDRRWMAETTSPVTAMLDRRRTYYELAEPMARLAFQIKDNRGEPLRVIVDFLKHWFDPADLAAKRAHEALAYLERAAAAQSGDAVVAATRAIAALPRSGGPVGDLLAEVDDALASLQAGTADLFLALPAPVRSALEARLNAADLVGVRVSVHGAAFEEAPSKADELARWLGRAKGLVAASASEAEVLITLVQWQAMVGELDDALAVVRTLPPARSLVQVHSTLFAWWIVCIGLVRTGRLVDAVDAVAGKRGSVDPESPGADPFLDYLLAVVASVHAAEGRPADAVDTIRAVFDRIAGLHPYFFATAGIPVVRDLITHGHDGAARQVQALMVAALQRDLEAGDTVLVEELAALAAMSADR